MPLPNQQMNLVLSSDAKPRLKWTPELHHRFIDAVKQLGGPEKATPKSLMRIMGIHGLTLYHLKSHLQKYRLGRSQQSQTYHHNKEEEEGTNSDEGENQRSSSMKKNKCNAEEEKIDDAKVAEALEMQDVQRKLQQQIEVQRHLQLRIEAQGKYLQSVLKKAQETLSGYSACSIEVEHARAQLSQLASMVDSGCSTSSFSVITQSDGSMLKEKLLGHSLESSLTSWESSDEEVNRAWKRSKSAVEETETGESSVKKKKIIDLNELDSGPTGIDLNCNGLQLFGSTF